MLLSTPVDISTARHPIVYSQKILTLGSCFAEQLSEHCRKYLYQITTNPFGVLYNPFSIARAIQTMVNGDMNVPVVQHDGLYHSLYHHSSFSNADVTSLLSGVQRSIIEGKQSLMDADVVIVTFGTAYVYELNDPSILYSGQFQERPYIVSNCHKLPTQHFTRRRMSVEEIVDLWQPILDFFPEKHWIFTVSPIRHKNDGMHGNQLSKSILLLAVDQLLTRNSQRQVDYFPAYEIVLDELRDYRYYADDMLHPSSMAMQYVWEKFSQTYFYTTDAREQKEKNKLYFRTQHRPIVPPTTLSNTPPPPSVNISFSSSRDENVRIVSEKLLRLFHSNHKSF